LGENHVGFADALGVIDITKEQFSDPPFVHTTTYNMTSHMQGSALKFSRLSYQHKSVK